MESPEAMVDRLVRATNEHDLDALVACFSAEYVNEAPAHPARGFRGQAQVRRNWQQIFGFVPDLHATVSATAINDTAVWTEWEMSGTRRDGSAHHMRGVVIFGVRGGVAEWARFYLEPVDESTSTVDDAVRQQVMRG